MRHGAICYSITDEVIYEIKNEIVYLDWFFPDYTSGLAFAIARNESEAKKLIEEERGYEVFTWGDLEIRPITHRVAKSVSGGS